jgi:uncharacterized protein YjbI with pentapeptide repeats
MSAGALPPKAPQIPEELELLNSVQLAHGSLCAAVELRSLALSGCSARGVALEDSRLADIDADEGRLEEARLHDCEAEGCNLANVQAARARLLRVRLRR